MQISKATTRMIHCAALIAACLLLGACGSRDIKSSTSTVASVPSDFDMVLRADKDGQFDFDGATLAPEDLRGHLRYRIEVQKPVHRLLLKNSDKVKIKKNHIVSLASIAHDLNIEAFIDDGAIKAIKMEQ